MPRPTGQELAELGRATRWPKGVSGNPKGGKLSAAINRELDADGVAERLVRRVLQKIEDEGDVSAFREILDRHEGKVPQKVEAKTENYFFVEEIDRDWEGEESP